jgi:hypothetical protein
MTEVAGDLERLGETREWGLLMLHLLELDGWKVTIRPRLADGVLVYAQRDRLVIFRAGDTIADVAVELFLASRSTSKQQRSHHSVPTRRGL